MEGVKFLDDDEITALFTEEPEPEKADNVLTMSNEEAARMFDNNPTDDTIEEPEPQPEPQPAPQKQSEKVEEPKSNIDFASIAKQFSDEGIFQELSSDDLSNIKDVDSFKRLISEAINNGIDETTRRVNEALELGVDRNDVVEFEETIKFLHAIKKEDILGETAESDNLRHKLILQNFINEGMDQKEAVEAVKLIFKDGNDITEAEKALQSNKEYFQKAYRDAIEEKRKEEEVWKSDIETQTKNIKTAIMDSSKYLGEIELDENTKKLAFKNLSEPTYKDRKTGELLTAIQQYERNNKTEFLKNLGILFTLTDGFKNLNKLVNSTVRRRVNKEINDIESVLRNPSNNESNLKMVTNTGSERSMFKFDV